MAEQGAAPESAAASGGVTEAALVKERQEASWGASAALYSKWMVEHQLMKGLFPEFLAELEPALRNKEGAQILDVASASGEPAATLAAALPQSHVTATDLAPQFMELGRARAAHLGLHNISFQVADAEQLSQFADGSFDAVTCSLGLMFLPDYPAALAEFLRVLHPGGRLAVTAWHKMEAVPFFACIRRLASELDPEPAPAQASPSPYNAQRFGDPSGLLKSIAAAGFGNVMCRTVAVTFSLPPDSWWDALQEMPLPLKATLEKLKKAQPQPGSAFLDEARQRIQARLEEHGWLQEGGGLCATGNACWFITAQRMA